MKPHYPELRIEHIVYLARLRIEYLEFMFFDSMHVSLALLNNLIYYGIGEVVRRVIEYECLKDCN